MEKFFSGSFNKRKGLVEWQQLNRDYGYEYEADTQILNKVSQQIVSAIGKKDKYYVQDVVRFFREFYYAYPIRLTDFYDHMGGVEYICSTEKERHRYEIKCDNDIDGLNKGEGYGGRYCYIADIDGNPSQEKSVTLVIPISYNKELQARYPEYSVKIEKRRIDYDRNLELFKDEFSQAPVFCGAQNVIITVGSFDGETVNSIKVVLGELELPDVEYALEFFRIHS